MTFHHMSHLCKEMGTKCTVKHTEKPQIQDPKREGECDNSVTLANINCDSAFKLLPGMSHSEEAPLTPPQRGPAPGGKEET